MSIKEKRIKKIENWILLNSFKSLLEDRNIKYDMQTFEVEGLGKIDEQEFQQALSNLEKRGFIYSRKGKREVE